MTPHTPGPWTTDALYIYSKGVTIAVVYNATEDVDVSPEQAAADARLIAAAPDLLAALEEIMGAFEHIMVRDGSGDLRPLHNPIVDRAHAAIARARGETA